MLESAKRGNELISVQRGEVIGSRFRILGISRNSIEVVDRELNLPHSLAFVETRPTDANRSAQQQPFRPTAVDPEDQ